MEESKVFALLPPLDVPTRSCMEKCPRHKIIPKAYHEGKDLLQLTGEKLKASLDANNTIVKYDQRRQYETSKGKIELPEDAKVNRS